MSLNHSTPFGVSFQSAGHVGSGAYIVRIHEATDGVHGMPWTRALVVEETSPGRCIGYGLGKLPGDDTPILRASEAERLLRALARFGFEEFRWERIKNDLREERWMDLRRWRAHG